MQLKMALLITHRESPRNGIEEVVCVTKIVATAKIGQEEAKRRAHGARRSKTAQEVAKCRKK
jgi:hypothetical protein